MCGVEGYDEFFAKAEAAAPPAAQPSTPTSALCLGGGAPPAKEQPRRQPSAATKRRLDAIQEECAAVQGKLGKVRPWAHSSQPETPYTSAPHDCPSGGESTPIKCRRCGLLCVGAMGLAFLCLRVQ